MIVTTEHKRTIRSLAEIEQGICRAMFPKRCVILPGDYDACLRIKVFDGERQLYESDPWEVRLLQDRRFLRDRLQLMSEFLEKRRRGLSR